MKDAQKPDHVSLTTLNGRLREGRYVTRLPAGIRMEALGHSRAAAPIFLDYYIGSQLLWKGKSENLTALACEPLYGFKGKADPSHIVLDGQQRLTAMYYAFLAPDVPAPSRQNRFLYFIRVDQFLEEAYDQAFEYDWTLRGAEEGLEVRPGHADAHYWVGMASLNEGKVADAIPHFEEYLKLAPNGQYAKDVTNALAALKK